MPHVGGPPGRAHIPDDLVNSLYGILHEYRPVAGVFDDIMHREWAMDVEFVMRCF